MNAAPSSANIGRWRITTAPAGWFFVPDFGLRHNAPDPASNIHLNEDELLAGDKLAPYVEVQKSMLARKHDHPAFAGPQPTTLIKNTVDEAMMLLIRHQPMRGTNVLQVQTYVRIEKWIGIATLTTTMEMVSSTRPDYEQFLATLNIDPA